MSELVFCLWNKVLIFIFLFSPAQISDMQIVSSLLNFLHRIWFSQRGQHNSLTKVLLNFSLILECVPNWHYSMRVENLKTEKEISQPPQFLGQVHNLVLIALSRTIATLTTFVKTSNCEV